MIHLHASLRQDPLQLVQQIWLSRAEGCAYRCPCRSFITGAYCDPTRSRLHFALIVVCPNPSTLHSNQQLYFAQRLMIIRFYQQPHVMNHLCFLFHACFHTLKNSLEYLTIGPSIIGKFERNTHWNPNVGNEVDDLGKFLF